MSRATLEPGDCRDVLLEMAACGELFDACVTDPPYCLESIRKRFGKPGSAPAKHAKDGSYGRLSKGFMSATWDGDIAHRADMWCAVSDVLKPGGHVLAFGAPRTHHRMVCAIEDAGFEIFDGVLWLFGQGWPKRKGLLKPAHELICVARKPGPIVPLNTEDCRIPLADDDPLQDGVTHAERAMDESGAWGFKAVDRPAGLPRWPANVVHDGSDEALAVLPGRSGDYFYCAKATKADRAGSGHPTIKPLALMRWLCRLVTPPGGRVLDPFAGSGTTLQAAVECGFDAVGIEQSAEYQADIRRRLETLELMELCA